MGVKGISLTTTNVYGEGDYAEERAVTIVCCRRKAIDKGNFLWFWKKNRLQSWKMYRDCFNSDNPTSASRQINLFIDILKERSMVFFCCCLKSVLQVCDARTVSYVHLLATKINRSSIYHQRVSTDFTCRAGQTPL